ncbi:transcriptional repressor [Carboxylicivirga sp. A043]|uniref:Fur family transcriptional regulator n=1 Tax=Carboxylicivirga litoralis TaxID=2816963 RepID=UPI0021CB77A4|nr:transcriptional repressor [Carboxylicivirga sp. A043]MCU4158337.1 transcriptional repressor [Carboxylicivirga sp. A043]
MKRTACRDGILEVILAAGQALSETEIRERLSGDFDRTTFYRSFKTLHEHQIIHKIVVDNQLTKYALDNSVTNKKPHAHFYCDQCQAVKCLDNIPVQNYQLPQGYTNNETEVLIKGTCCQCKPQDKE